ncbi:uncharacterized protein LOC9630378 [Selaginella moellendorffii]|uniref:uncharacterized protein LOC9630378 n=1 Tax=Selaginella moellendorffii TaxID=88036 RepID=UPI000D1C6235|nr:uncharacterized protein LOC9630378 [Selaginella moellendorffii]|eukprot:XP_002975726.2 uncharacterized protein LOC9630378 [Selaginella moellendorffii]
MNNNPVTPSPAELAQFLVRSSSASRPSSNAPLLPNAPAAAFRPFPANAPAPNIALLAQFLAAQLRAFTPAQNSQQQQQPFEAFPPLGKPAANDLAASSLQQRAGPAPKPGVANAKASNKQPKTDEKDASSSSANASNPSPQCADTNDASKGRSELVFLVNRRSKVGAGTHHLILSDLSAYFHLSIVDAAKKLGVSQTTLKKACRKFGLKRWPGRKVRSLESTIHGLEHTIAVGQGAGMEELTEAYMRSEVLKLQQEMEQLVHGIPAAQVNSSPRPSFCSRAS